GNLFRRVSSTGKVWGEAVTEKLVWHVVKEFAAKIGVNKLAPHVLRRTCARLCRTAGGELEQIQFLGHVSVQTTERYFGCTQRIASGVNDVSESILKPEASAPQEWPTIHCGLEPTPSQAPTSGPRTNVTSTAHRNPTTSSPQRADYATVLKSAMNNEKVLKKIRQALAYGERRLDLAGEKLCQLPTELAWLKEIKSLDLVDNHLTELPSELFGLTELTSLDIKRNLLTGLSGLISGLTKLTDLGLADNQLENLPREIG